MKIVKNTVFDPKEIAGMQFVLISDDVNSGIPAANTVEIIFKASYGQSPQKFCIDGTYEEIKPIVDGIMEAIIDAT
jgi:hypothetical protein